MTNFSLDLSRGHSTSICTSILKRTVDYYTNRGSHIFCCFLDFRKAFDRVNYWKLFDKLLDDGVNSKIVRTMMFWYSHQQMCVPWQSTVSSYFLVNNGTRQGDVLSPYLFCRSYVIYSTV